MGVTRVEGKQVRLPQSPAMLFPLFSDLRNFVNNLPEDKKKEITATQDSILGKVQGFELGVEVEERMPFSYIKLKEYGMSPFHFNIWLNFTPEESGSRFNIVLEAELNMMIKMMIGNKLQEAVDKITEQLEMVLNGNIPQEYAEYFKK